MTIQNLIYNPPKLHHLEGPLPFFVTREWALFLCVKRERGFIFSVIRESIFFRSRETDFRCFSRSVKMFYLHVICETSTFVGIIFHFFGDFSVIKARKLDQTGCKKRDGMPFSTSLDARDGWRTEN